MRIKAKILNNMYKNGKITLEGLQKALADNVITEEEYQEIINNK